ncbi:MAG: hypothetical protein R2851_25880 [Caldilineaceae bacterium]
MITEDGVHLAGMHYKVLLVEHDGCVATPGCAMPLRAKLACAHGRGHCCRPPIFSRADVLAALPDVTVNPPTPAQVPATSARPAATGTCSSTRNVRRCVCATMTRTGARFHFNTVTGESTPLADDDALDFAGYELKVIGLLRRCLTQ